MNASTSNRIDFSTEDERKMANAATWGQIIAVCSVLTAAIRVVVALAGGESLPSVSIGAGVQATLGVALFFASAAFRRVANTDNNDHGNLRAGFRHLRTYFMVQGIVLILVLVAVVAALLFGVELLAALP